MEESRIVSEVTFAESSSGAATVTGTYMGADQAHISSVGARGFQRGDSRTMTIEKTKVRMHKIATKLNIPDHVVQRALQYFKLALVKNFVKGRKSQHVVSACLYVACRQNFTQHMLMDFADAIYVNVFAIGATYLQLVKVLGIEKIPVVDPSIYIRRFVARLAFGEEGSKKVMDDANRLAHRMNRDWLVMGRRPAGIAAACILLAARMNNFRRSKAEVVQVAKIAEETVQRRLDEFKSTSAGTLTVADFRSTQIESEADPPSFTKHRVVERKLADLQAKRIAAYERGELMDEDNVAADEQVKAILEEIAEIEVQEKKMARIQAIEARKQQKREQKFVKQEMAKEELMENVDGQEAREGGEAEGGQHKSTDDDPDEHQGSAKGVPEKDTETNNEEEAIKQTTDDGQVESDGEADEHQDSAKDVDVEKAPEKDTETNVEEGVEKQEEEEGEEDIEIDIDEEEIEKEVNDVLKDSTFFAATRAQLIVKKYQEEREAALRGVPVTAGVSERAWKSKIGDDPINSDDDDDEVNQAILTKEERKIKTEIWMSLNRDYLIEQEKKRLRLEAEQNSPNYKPPRKRRKPAASSSNDAPAAPTTGVDATKSMMKTRAFSKKINYDAIGSLFKHN